MEKLFYLTAPICFWFAIVFMIAWWMWHNRTILREQFAKKEFALSALFVGKVMWPLWILLGVWVLAWVGASFNAYECVSYYREECMEYSTYPEPWVSKIGYFRQSLNYSGYILAFFAWVGGSIGAVCASVYMVYKFLGQLWRLLMHVTSPVRGYLSAFKVRW